MELKDWLVQNNLDGEIDSCFLKLNDVTYFILTPQDIVHDNVILRNIILTPQFQFALPEKFYQTEIETEFVVFEFGNSWYWSSVQ